MQTKKYYNAVNRIGWAYMIKSFGLNFGNLDILPDWITFMMIYSVLEIVAQQEPSAVLLKPVAVILGWTSALGWVLKLFGITLDYYIYGLIITVLDIYFTFQLITNIYDVRCRLGCKTGKNFKNIRTAITITGTVIFICLQFGILYNMMLAIAIINGLVIIWLSFALLKHGDELQKMENGETIKFTEHIA